MLDRQKRAFGFRPRMNRPPYEANSQHSFRYPLFLAGILIRKAETTNAGSAAPFANFQSEKYLFLLVAFDFGKDHIPDICGKTVQIATAGRSVRMVGVWMAQPAWNNFKDNFFPADRYPYGVNVTHSMMMLQ